jgi:glutamine synthetase
VEEFADKLEAKSGNDKKNEALAIIKEEIKGIKSILFNGDNYSAEWHAEAEKRGLPNLKTTPIALKALATQKASSLFEKHKVYSSVELKSRYHIHLERYIKDIDIESKTLYDMVITEVIPAAMKYQKILADAISGISAAINSKPVKQTELLKEVSGLIEKILTCADALKSSSKECKQIESEQEKAEAFCNKVKAKMDEMRVYVDSLEALVDNEIWPLPKFWEMLFIS